MKLVLDFLLITGILLTSLILILLFRKNNKEPHHKVLIGIFVAIFLVFLNYYAYLHRIWLLYYLTEVFADSTDVFIGPLFLVYIKGITGQHSNSFRNNLAHFIFPFSYLFGISIPDALGSVVKEFGFSYIGAVQDYLFITILYSFGYCVYSLWKLIRFQELVKFNYSNVENKDLAWAKYLLVGSLVILGIDVLSSILEDFSIDIGNDDGFMTVISAVFLVVYLGYFGVAQSKILLPDFLLQMEGNTSVILSDDGTSDVTKKYSYDATDMKLLEAKLKILMKERKPYLNEDLTLAILSDLLEVTDKKLSALLNQNMATSFYDYVNGFRVEEVKLKMSWQESDKYTLLAIAYDCGFKSKSSFNRIFKKSTRLSPSDYRKRLISNDK